MTLKGIEKDIVLLVLVFDIGIRIWKDIFYIWEGVEVIYCVDVGEVIFPTKNIRMTTNEDIRALLHVGCRIDLVQHKDVGVKWENGGVFKVREDLSFGIRGNPKIVNL